MTATLKLYTFHKLSYVQSICRHWKLKSNDPRRLCMNIQPIRVIDSQNIVSSVVLNLVHKSNSITRRIYLDILYA